MCAETVWSKKKMVQTNNATPSSRRVFARTVFNMENPTVSAQEEKKEDRPVFVPAELRAIWQRVNMVTANGPAKGRR